MAGSKRSSGSRVVRLNIRLIRFEIMSDVDKLTRGVDEMKTAVTIEVNAICTSFVGASWHSSSLSTNLVGIAYRYWY
jgi:hypothetical protein